MQISTDRSRVVAVLGPTNTGKTYLALERMLGHGSGMIGFPLRLLARENYDRAVRIKGARRVALITGEEKIVPRFAKYFFCTVESMPVTKPVAFLAIDEIQLCADPERGHVFTDRLLNARGTEETMFMGAETARRLIERLVPEAEFVGRPRFSTLTFQGAAKIVRLPPRSAVVGFTTAEVYAIAEILRRQKGGAAIVMGALSPRTRNAQVAMYQSGEVDYLVATDAIGMGLNMDVDHVAFSQLDKFDGRERRPLRADELGQIAGRAGRHMSDGTFGTTADSPPIALEIAEAIENHRFDPIRAFFWRSSALRYASIEALTQSLAEAPPVSGLVRAGAVEDETALADLARDPGIRDLAQGAERVKLLWDVCRIPDFRKLAPESHIRLLGRLYRTLAAEGTLPNDWLADQVARLDRVDGSIETLLERITQIRTWTYVSHQGNWLADAAEWQERTRAVEDHLSDALHERLTQRFVDSRTATLVRRLKNREPLEARVDESGEVFVENHFVGTLEGFRFVADAADSVEGGRAMRAAARRALAREVTRRAQRLLADADDAFALGETGRITWQGRPVARLVPGAEVIRPRIVLDTDSLFGAPAAERIAERLDGWLANETNRRLAPLFALRDGALPGPVRGLAFRLVEGLGVVPRRDAEAQLATLSDADRAMVRKLGIRLGLEFVYLAPILKPGAAALCGLLWAVQAEHAPVPAPLPASRVSVAVDEAVPDGFYLACGFAQAGGLAIRVDILERVLAQARALSRKGRAFEVPSDVLNLAGCGLDHMTALLERFGYEARRAGETVTFRRKRRARPNRSNDRRGGGGRGKAREDSPFAKLKDLAPSP